MIQIYYGDGKGKTTAAIGAAIRAAGQNFEVFFCQFMKGNPSGELIVLEKIPQIQILRPKRQYPFYKEMTTEQKAELKQEHDAILDELLSITDETNRLLILDEITYPVNYDLITRTKLSKLLEKYQKIELILTGRDPSDELLQAADYLTEMKKIRHPYDKGVTARLGIEY